MPLIVSDERFSLPTAFSLLVFLITTAAFCSAFCSAANEQQRQRQKRFFEQTLKIALEQPAVKAYMFWDFVDDYSWLHKTDRKIYNIEPGTYTHPTPFWCGKECPISPKQSYFAMLETLKTTPQVYRPD